MRTTKNISTISYNTEDFLLKKLKDLVDNHIINSYMYIIHDKDEITNNVTGEIETKKKHIHLVMEPSKQIDTIKLQSEFNEIDPNNDKPLKVRPFKTSDLANWVDYVKHIPVYISRHCQNDTDGKKEYTDNDIVTNDDDYKFNAISDGNYLLESDPLIVLDGLLTMIDNSGYISYSKITHYVIENGLMDVYHKYKHEIKDVIVEHNQDHDKLVEIQKKADRLAVQTISKITKENSIIENLTTNFDKVTIENENDTFDVMRIDYKKKK